MKIIGGHDYYDGAGFGVDESCLFLRDKAISIQDVDAFEDHPFALSGRHTFRKDRRDFTVSFLLIVVAGELHPGMRLEKSSYWDSHGFHESEETISYSVEDAIHAIESSLGVMPQVLSNEPSTFKRISFAVIIEQNFSREIKSAEYDWILTHKIKVLTVECEGERRRGKIYARKDHGCLKDYQFYRKMEPATLHMRLANFISGVLTENRDTLAISDTSKIIKAGFDTKTSFRKMSDDRSRKMKK